MVPERLVDFILMFLTCPYFDQFLANVLKSSLAKLIFYEFNGGSCGSCDSCVSFHEQRHLQPYPHAV
jgi:hypothetical protein